MEPDALVRAVRRRSGLTQGALAERAGTSQPVVSAYEHGRREPSITTLRRLVAAGGELLVLDSAAASTGDVPPATTPEEHGRRLVDVLSLADAVPRRPSDPELRAPRMASRC